MITSTYRYSKALCIRTAMEGAPFLHHWRSNFLHYFVRCLPVGFTIMLSDLWFGNGIKVIHILGPVILCSAALAVLARREWMTQVKTTAEDLDLTVELEERGVKSRWVGMYEFSEWDFYLWYEEFPDVIKLVHRTGGISFIPRLPETVEVIAYTKSRVPARYRQADQ